MSAPENAPSSGPVEDVVHILPDMVGDLRSWADARIATVEDVVRAALAVVAAATVGEPGAADGNATLADLVAQGVGPPAPVTVTESSHGWRVRTVGAPALLGPAVTSVLRAALTDPARPAGDLPLVGEHAWGHQVRTWNRGAGPVVSTAHGACHQEIAARAAEHPDAEAVVDGRQVLRYGELDSRANRLAHHLRALGAGPDGPVAVHLPRGPELVVALLGVLRAGAAYLPLDPAAPAARTNQLLADASPTLMVTTSALPRVAAPSTVAVTLDEDDPTIARRPSTAPDVVVAADDLAYVIHTSGSTGTPKGVMVPHGALTNLVEWHLARYGLTRQDRSAHLAAVGFDAAVWEIWPVLVAGGTLHLPTADDRLEPDRLPGWLIDRGITVTFLPTPVAEAAFRSGWPAGPGPRAILVGGDVLGAAPAGLPFELVNHYGPTEAGVVATAATVDPGEAGPPPIGLPIRDVRVHILDRRLRPLPIGMPGELCIGGAGLARGYLGRPGQTADRFVPDPFHDGARLYRTGDIARHRDDGTLEFVGRKDDQASIRGVRVEPGEVASRLRAHPDVEDAVVLARPDAIGALTLVAYVTPAGRRDPAPAGLREHLRDLLPAAMVPGPVVVVPSFPLTPHGKLDRAALPDPRAGAGSESVPPRDEVDDVVADVWYEMLGEPDRSRDVTENFFALGGNSLLAAQLTARLRDLFDIELPAQTALRAETVTALVTALRHHQPAPGHVEFMARTLREVEELSDEEVEDLLSELGGGPRN